jgi:hypothetical protein
MLKKIINFYYNNKPKNFNDFLFLITHKLVSNLNFFFKNRPSSQPFLSGDTYKKLCTLEYNGGKLVILKPEIIFLSADYIKDFKKNLKNIKKKFILISHHSDKLINSSYQSIANNRYLIKWYAQNNIYKHPKITPIPIGLEDMWRYNNGIISHFKYLRKLKIKKKPKIIYGFKIQNNKTARLRALNTLKKLQLADEFIGTSKAYRKELNQYMFVASPEGNGIDCHRTWEALYLRVIPIVITKKFHSQFKNLPVLILNKWDDLNKFNSSKLLKIYIKQVKKIKLSKYIWSNYWKKKIISEFKHYQ